MADKQKTDIRSEKNKQIENSKKTPEKKKPCAITPSKGSGLYQKCGQLGYRFPVGGLARCVRCFY